MTIVRARWSNLKAKYLGKTVEVDLPDRGTMTGTVQAVGTKMVTLARGDDQFTVTTDVFGECDALNRIRVLKGGGRVKR
jgi:hypothetical protein